MTVIHIDLTNKEEREAFLARNSVPSPEREKKRQYQKLLYKWFNENRNGIIADHHGESVLLKDNKVLGYYSDTKTAISAALEMGLQMGDFLAQDCLALDEGLTLHVGFQII